MSLNIPAKTSIFDTIIAIWQSIRPDADSTIYGDLWLYAKTNSVLVFRLHQTVERGINAIFPTTSYGTYLDNWLNWIGASDGSGGYGRIIPRTSSATDGLSCTYSGGAPGATVVIGSTLTDTGGLVYTPTENLLGAGTPEAISLVSVSTGAAANLEVGAVLTWDSTPAGWDDTATIVVDLDGGADRETDSEGRARLLSLLQNPPSSGNVASWVQTIENASPGALKAFVWPKRELQPNGYGRTDYMAFQTAERGSARGISIGSALYTAISDAVDSEQMVLIARNSRQLTADLVTCNVEVTITLSDDATDDQKCDWDAESAVRRTVASHDAGGAPNNEIVASGVVAAASRANGLLAGDRVVINGIEATVATAGVVDGLGNDSTFRLTAWPYSTVAAALVGDNVTAGGGLIGEKTQGTTTGSGAVLTIQDYMDALGPAKGAYAAGAQIADWDDTARVQGIQSDLIQFGDGFIIDVTVDDLAGGGAVDKTPTAGSGASTDTLYLTEPTVWQVFV